MTLHAWRVGVPVVALLLLAVGGRSLAQEPAAGAKALAPFKQRLGAALREGMARGPAEAVAACRLEAPRIARSLERDGVRVGRASHRLRNPANAAPGWVQPLLEGYVKDPADREPRNVSLPDGRTGYVEPILVQPLCLTCHGESLAPDVAARIDALYPEDQARGFGVGDLRGVFWVEVPEK